MLSSGRFAGDSVGDPANADPDACPPFIPELSSWSVIDGCAVFVERDGVGISVPVAMAPSRSTVNMAAFVVVRLRVQGQSVTVIVSPPVAVYVTPLVLNFVDDGHTVVNDETIVVKGGIISVEDCLE